MDNFIFSNFRNPYYQRAIKKEIHSTSEDYTPSWPPAIDLHPLINSYSNEQILGKPNNDDCHWLSLLIDNFKSVDVGLSLGSGSGKHEAYIQSKKFVKRWDCIDVSNNFSSLNKSPSTSVISSDLNFIVLPEKKYKLIFSCNILKD